MYAAKLDSLNIIQEIVKSSQWNTKLLELKDFSGNTVLHHAVFSNNIQMITYLLQLGADPEISNLNGKDCFEIAEQREFEKALLILREPSLIDDVNIVKKLDGEVQDDQKKKSQPQVSKNSKEISPNQDTKKPHGEFLDEPPAYSNEESDWEVLEPMQLVDEFTLARSNRGQNQTQHQIQFRNERNRALSQISSLFNGEKRERSQSQIPSASRNRSLEFKQDRKQGLQPKLPITTQNPKRNSSVN